MPHLPRQLAGIGASDLPDSAAFDAYVGPSREVVVDHTRGIIALHDGVTPGGKQFQGELATKKYPTVTGMNQVSVPAVHTVLEIAGYSAVADGGRWPIAVEVAHDVADPVKPWQFVTKNNRRFQLKTEVVDPCMFGMKSDGTNILTAWDNANQFAGLDPTKPKQVRFNQPGDYRLEGILTCTVARIITTAAFGVRVYRNRGTFATIAAQAVECEISGFIFDWMWSMATDAEEASLGYRGAIIYNTMDRAVIRNNMFLNAPGNHIISNGRQKNGLAYGGGAAPTVPYTTGWSCFNNTIKDNYFQNAYFGAIINEYVTGNIVTGNRIFDVGAEVYTLDGYSSRNMFSNNYCYNVAVRDGRPSGVGAIGIDSGFNNIIMGNTFENIHWAGGFTAAIHCLGVERSPIDNIIFGNTFLNCEGPGVYIDNGVSTTPIIGPVGTPSMPLRNIFASNTFTNCGRLPAFLASLPWANTAGAVMPTGVAIYIAARDGQAAANKFMNNNLGTDAFIDAPDSMGVNDPLNPNNTESDHLNSLPWLAWKGTVDSQGGAFGKVDTDLTFFRPNKNGKRFSLTGSVTTTTVGGAAGAIQIHIGKAAANDAVGYVRSTTDGETLHCYIEKGQEFISIRKNDNTNPVLTNGKRYILAIEVPTV